MIDLAGAALALVERGWAVLPLVPGGKAPLGQLVPHGWHDASADPALVASWWARQPRANIGVACQMSGLVVIDFDPRDGPDDLHELEDRLGPLPETVRALTGSAGSHILLAHPGVELVGRLSPGVEVKSRHYIVVAPSRHPSGRRYEWEVEPGEVELAAVPEQWLAAMRAPERLVPARERGEDDDPLLNLTPPQYFEVLAGVTPGPGGGFVSCPVPGHADAHPSCRVWPTVDGGWCCFSHPGGRVGGGVFQLAALLGGWR